MWRTHLLVFIFYLWRLQEPHGLALEEYLESV